MEGGAGGEGGWGGRWDKKERRGWFIFGAFNIENTFTYILKVRLMPLLKILDEGKDF